MEHQSLKLARGIEDYIKEVFYHLHQNPELSAKEYNTQKFILTELEKMGIEAQPIADTGVMGIIRGAKPGKTVAFRADMDALPIQEKTDLPYKSVNPGVMHACGHDSHMTVVLGVAKILQAQKDELKGNVKLFFQPAEETIGGARRMIEAGCLENPKVDAVFFAHSTPTAPTGSIKIMDGIVSASSNYFDIVFKGRGAHGASPHLGTDVIVAASQAVVALQTICSRRTDPNDAVVVTIGSFHAGTAGNILPATAKLNGMMRTLKPTVRERAIKDFYQILNGIASAMDVEVEIDIKAGYIASVNNPEMYKLVRNSAVKVLGEEKIVDYNTPTLEVEDFSYFCQAVKGCYYLFGVKNEEKGWVNPLHNDKFIVDIEGIICDIAVKLQIAKDFLEQE